MGEAIAALLWMLLEVVLATTGRFFVATLSFGRWRGENLRSQESRIHAPAGALSYRRDGQRVITTSGLLFVGGLAYGLLAVALLWWAARP